MRLIVAAGLLALSACATAGAPGSDGANEVPTQVINTGDAIHVSTSAESRLLTHDITAPVDRVWQVLPDVYRELGVQANADAAMRTVSTPSVSFTRRMFGEPATRFVDCGRGQFGTEVAATYTIHLTVRTTVQPGATPSTSRLESQVQAYARNNDGANALASQCRSKGLLEGLIALRVLEKLGASPTPG
ncbi:MAG: hypothetical protein KY467_19170 [Gemmatimonadetes bacterium]|nr:hypothetical protein [Gemmatimonadota bacterium]